MGSELQRETGFDQVAPTDTEAVLNNISKKKNFFINKEGKSLVNKKKEILESILQSDDEEEGRNTHITDNEKKMIRSSLYDTNLSTSNTNDISKKITGFNQNKNKNIYK